MRYVHSVAVRDSFLFPMRTCIHVMSRIGRFSQHAKSFIRRTRGARLIPGNISFCLSVLGAPTVESLYQQPPTLLRLSVHSSACRNRTPTGRCSWQMNGTCPFHIYVQLGSKHEGSESHRTQRCPRTKLPTLFLSAQRPCARGFNVFWNKPCLSPRARSILEE